MLLTVSLTAFFSSRGFLLCLRCWLVSVRAYVDWLVYHRCHTKFSVFPEAANATPGAKAQVPVLRPSGVTRNARRYAGRAFAGSRAC